MSGYPLSPIELTDETPDPNDPRELAAAITRLSQFRIERLFLIPQTVTASYSIVPESDRIILTNGGTLTVTLPAATDTDAVFYCVKKIDTTASGDTTVATPGSETIDGAASVTLTDQYQSVFIVSDGSNYFIV